MVLVLAGLPEMLGALLAAILLFAAIALVRLIIGVLPDWHIPGFSSIRGWAISAADSVLSTMRGWLMDAAKFIGALIMAPVHFVTGLIDKIINVGLAAYAMIAHIVTVTIPHAVAALRAEIAHDVAIIDIEMHDIVDGYKRAVAGAEAWAAARIGALESATASGLASVRSWAADEMGRIQADYRHLIALAAAAATAEIAAALHRAESEIGAVDRQLTADITATAAWARAAIADALAHAEHFATDVAHSAAAAAIRAEETATAAVVGAVWQGIVTDVDAAIATAEADFTDVVDGLRAIPRVIEADIPASIAAVGALSIPVLRIMRDCVMPNCRNLGQLGRELHNLLGDAETAAFLALLAEIATHPTRAADEIVNLVGGIVDDAAHAAESLLGV